MLTIKEIRHKLILSAKLIKLSKTLSKCNVGTDLVFNKKDPNKAFAWYGGGETEKEARKTLKKTMTNESLRAVFKKYDVVLDDELDFRTL